MELLTELLRNGPDDPLLLAGVLVAAWVPVCFVGLCVLTLLAWTQVKLGQRRKRGPAVSLPPAEVRPLAARRYVSVSAKTGDPIRLARVGVALAAVAAATAMALSANGTALLAALRG